MNGIMDIIEDNTKSTGGKRFKTHKFCYDTNNSSIIEYDVEEEVQWSEFGETARYTHPIDLRDKLSQVSNIDSCFTYFLDGSRHIYKVDDMAFGKEVFPIVAGQVGISCCKRINKEVTNEFFNRKLVLALPSRAFTSTWKNKQKVEKDAFIEKINNSPKLKSYGLKFSDILIYSKDTEAKYEKKAVACIQDYMVMQEKLAVQQLVSEQKVKAYHYLIKDGTLEYKVVKDNKNLNFSAQRFRDDFRYVIGISKSFNPTQCYIKGRGTDSKIVASLKPFYRTPACRYESKISGNGVYFCVWYLRIRDSIYTQNVFDGILKIEKLMTPEEQDKGVDSEMIDYLSAQILRERTPVCYGDDNRWANHIYPVYVTERFAKSKYINNETFMSLF